VIRRLTTSICPLSHTGYKSLFLKKISPVFGHESSGDMAQKLPESQGAHRPKSGVLAKPRLSITDTSTAHTNSIIRCLDCKRDAIQVEPFRACPSVVILLDETDHIQSLSSTLSESNAFFESAISPSLAREMSTMSATKRCLLTPADNCMQLNRKSRELKLWARFGTATTRKRAHLGRSIRNPL
jgi:hypothetical protein